MLKDDLELNDISWQLNDEIFRQISLNRCHVCQDFSNCCQFLRWFGLCQFWHLLLTKPYNKAVFYDKKKKKKTAATTTTTTATNNQKMRSK